MLLEPDIPKVVIIHRNYLRPLPLGARNHRGRDGDIYQNPSHSADFVAWMNRHPPGDINVDWQLHPLSIHTDINENLDGALWKRCRLPEPSIWLRS